MTLPLVASDEGDVYVFDDLDAIYAGIEAIDAPTIEIFDATGRRIHVMVEGYRWRIDRDRLGDPEPERVEVLLRNYFARLPNDFASYSARAADASNLEELIRLRRELADEPQPGFRGRVFRQRWQ